MSRKKTYLLFGLTALLCLPALAIAQTFVPLTNLPGVQQAASSETLPAFFNNLYKLCIGAAAVIAVLQIMRAGMYFMFNKGSVAHNEQGKSLISNSLLGLLLVLSPAIVFGIINPDILDLRLDIRGLVLRDSTVDQWIDSCDITATTEQHECAGSIRTAIEQEYATCRQGNPETACQAQAQRNARLRITRCINGITNQNNSISNQSLSCVDQQVLSWLGATQGADTTGGLRGCEKYQPSSFSVHRSDSGANVCPAVGKVLVDPQSCCTGLRNVGDKCCGVPLLSHFVTEFYYTREATTGTCYVSGIKSYPTAVQCQADKTAIRAVTSPEVVFVKDCETMDSVPTSFTPAVSVPRCAASPNN